MGQAQKESLVFSNFLVAEIMGIPTYLTRYLQAVQINFKGCNMV